jgi:hypothetical protein
MALEGHFKIRDRTVISKRLKKEVDLDLGPLSCHPLHSCIVITFVFCHHDTAHEVTTNDIVSRTSLCAAQMFLQQNI